MEVTYKNKKYQIKCDDGMPLYAQDGIYLECGQTVSVCKQCILKHLGEEENGGWDEEDNTGMDMFITIAGNKHKL